MDLVKYSMRVISLTVVMALAVALLSARAVVAPRGHGGGLATPGCPSIGETMGSGC